MLVTSQLCILNLESNHTVSKKLKSLEKCVRSRQDMHFFIFIFLEKGKFPASATAHSRFLQQSQLKPCIFHFYVQENTNCLDLPRFHQEERWPSRSCDLQHKTRPDLQSGDKSCSDVCLSCWSMCIINKCRYLYYTVLMKWRYVHRVYKEKLAIYVRTILAYHTLSEELDTGCEVHQERPPS